MRQGNLFDEIDQKDRIDELKRLWRICWNWQGPKVGEHIQCLNVAAKLKEPYLGSDGKYRYRSYTSSTPMKIIEELPGERFICAVEYEPDAPEHCLQQNGKEYILEILDIWPDVKKLSNGR